MGTSLRCARNLRFPLPPIVMRSTRRRSPCRHRRIHVLAAARTWTCAGHRRFALRDPTEDHRLTHAPTASGPTGRRSLFAGHVVGRDVHPRRDCWVPPRSKLDGRRGNSARANRGRRKQIRERRSACLLKPLCLSILYGGSALRVLGMFHSVRTSSAALFRRRRSRRLVVTVPRFQAIGPSAAGSNIREAECNVRHDVVASRDDWAVRPIDTARVVVSPQGSGPTAFRALGPTSLKAPALRSWSQIA